jgi:hypothetical protein
MKPLEEILIQAFQGIEKLSALFVEAEKHLFFDGRKE